MPDYLMMVFSGCKPGRDREFNDWYDQQHLAEVASLPSVVSARRYPVRAVFGRDTLPHDYLALYEVHAEAPETVLDELAAALPTWQLSDALDRDRVLTLVVDAQPQSQ